VRFLTPVASGTTPLGWTVEAQTMADLTAGKCVIVPAFAVDCAAAWGPWAPWCWASPTRMRP